MRWNCDGYDHPTCGQSRMIFAILYIRLRWIFRRGEQASSQSLSPPARPHPMGTPQIRLPPYERGAKSNQVKRFHIRTALMAVSSNMPYHYINHLEIMVIHRRSYFRFPIASSAILGSALFFTGCAEMSMTRTGDSSITAFLGADENDVQQQATRYCGERSPGSVASISLDRKGGGINNYPKYYSFQCVSRPFISSGEETRRAQEHERYLDELKRARAETEAAKRRQLELEEQLNAERKQATSPTKPANSSSRAPLDTAREKCKELGFKSGSEGFGKCVIQLSR